MPITLQPHQQVALDYFISSPNRGMFLLHGTGSGKTLSAIAIAEHLRNYKEVLIIAPKSLQDNFKHEMKRYGSRATDRYRFVSSNASNMIDKIETTKDALTGLDITSLHLDNKLVIIDEAHNLLVGMSNGSKNAVALYDLLMKAKRCRILLMTASGIINQPYEIIPALNICKGYIRTEDGVQTTLLPESAEDFKRFFVDEKESKLKNVDKLRNRIQGLISYKGDFFEHEVLSFFPMLMATIKKENYPDRLPIKIELIHMSSKQYGAYEQAREKERLETQRSIHGSGLDKTDRIVLHPQLIDGGELKQTSAFGKSTSYRIKSRQLSNVFQPEDININEHAETYAPKLKAIGDKLKPGFKSLIYSNFVKAGIEPMGAYLEHIGYKRYDPSKETESGIHGYYGVYTGDVSTDDRTATLQEYNKPNSPLTILLISSSGAEGLSTKGTRAVHILEPYWNYERILQVMARGIRYRSHEHLPEKERNVKVYIYLAVAPKNVKDPKDSKTTDLHLFNESKKKYEMNSEMIKLAASCSIECPQFNSEVNFECYKCEPRNGAPLFLADLNKDMTYPLPCKRDEKPINANEFSLNGQLYYISDDKKHIFVKTDSDEYNELVDRDIKEWVLQRA